MVKCHTASKVSWFNGKVTCFTPLNLVAVAIPTLTDAPLNLVPVADPTITDTPHPGFLSRLDLVFTAVRF